MAVKILCQKLSTTVEFDQLTWGLHFGGLGRRNVEPFLNLGLCIVVHLKQNWNYFILWRIVHIVVKYIHSCRIYVSLIMAPVRQFICVTEW
jgi:hypothetical protein